jgi:hypothetical protein
MVVIIKKTSNMKSAHFVAEAEEQYHAVFMDD